LRQVILLGKVDVTVVDGASPLKAAKRLIPDRVKRAYCTCVKRVPAGGEECGKCGRVMAGECYVTCSGFVLGYPICRECHDRLDDCVPPEVKRKYLFRLLAEFARWLKKERDYNSETVEELLYKPWDGAYPEELLGDDIIVDIENFLHDMAMFAVEKTFGAKVDQRFQILIVPFGSYDDCSSVYVFEMKAKTVMANLEEKTWHFSPEIIEEDLKDLVSQLEKSKDLLAVRLMADV
jgi:hypothetical protein